MVRKIESVQRLIAQKIIRSFKTVSYEAALTLSGLSPGRIHERALSYAVKHPNQYVHRIPNSHIDYTLVLSENYGIDLKKFESLNIISSSPPHLASEPKVSTSTLPDYPLFQKNTINIYTDGSKTNSGTGCAFVLFRSTSIEHGQCKLGTDNSVYQAELTAILHSFKHILTLPIYECFSQINIFSDSIPSLLSIKDSQTKNSIAQEIQKFVKFFSLFTIVKFNWCKGHNNILGNEMADFFAKESTLNPICLLKELPLPISHLKSTVKAKSLSTWVNR
jgi:ribonuclease HI